MMLDKHPQTRKTAVVILVATLLFMEMSYLVFPVFAAPTAVFVTSYDGGGANASPTASQVVPAGYIAIVAANDQVCDATPATPTLSDTFGSTFTLIATSATQTTSSTVECTSLLEWRAYLWAGVIDATGGSDTFTVSSADSGAGEIVAEIWSGVSPASDGSNTGIGNSASAVVTSFTPAATTSIVVGYYSACGTVTYSAGSGFTLDRNVGGATGCTAGLAIIGLGRGSEYRTSNGGAQTCPMTLSSSAKYAGVCGSFPLAVSIPVLCAMENGATSATVTFSGGTTPAPSPSTLSCNAGLHYISVKASTTITATEPADGGSTRNRFQVSNAESTTTTVSSCANGPICANWFFSNYGEVKNTCKATPLTPTTWEANHAINVYGVRVGRTSVIGTLAPASGGGFVTNANCWSDYNTMWIFGQTDIVATILWTPSPQSSSNLTTGGSTINADYTKRFASQTTTTTTSTSTTTTTTTTSTTTTTQPTVTSTTTSTTTTTTTKTTTTTTTTTTPTTTTTTTTTSTSTTSTQTINVGTADPPNYLWLLLVPIALIVLVAAKKRL